MTKSAKKQVAILLSMALGIFVILPSLFIYLADPCHLYHKPFSGPFSHGFTDFNPCQNAGLINTYLADASEGYDSILVGTSLSTNYLQDHIAKYTAWKKTMKITMPASAPVTQQIFIRNAIATGHVSHVFWEIFPYKYLPYRDMPEQGPPDELGDFPVYLFNNSILDDYRYFFNYTLLTASMGIIMKEDYFNRPSIDQINYWKNQCESAQSCIPFRTQEDIQEETKTFDKQQHQILPAQEIARLNYRVVDRYVLETVLPHCNKHTSFDLFIPPVSMGWLSQLPTDAFDYQLYLVRYLVTQTAHCKNIHIHAFSNIEWIVGDLSHYSDNFHFFADVQDYILKSFGNRQHLITTYNIDQFEANMVNQANRYTPWGSTQEQIRQRMH